MLLARDPCTLRFLASMLQRESLELRLCVLRRQSYRRCWRVTGTHTPIAVRLPLCPDMGHDQAWCWWTVWRVVLGAVLQPCSRDLFPDLCLLTTTLRRRSTGDSCRLTDSDCSSSQKPWHSQQRPPSMRSSNHETDLTPTVGTIFTNMSPTDTPSVVGQPWHSNQCSSPWRRN